MPKLPKTLRVPDVEYIKNLEDVKQVLRELINELQEQHIAIYSDLRIGESAQFKKNGVYWRVTVDGDDFVAQKLVSGTWTTTWTSKGS